MDRGRNNEGGAIQHARGKRLFFLILGIALAAFVLAGLIIPLVSRKRMIFRTFSWELRVKECIFEISDLADTIGKYREDHGSLPTSLHELASKYMEAGQIPRCVEDFVAGRPSYLYGGPNAERQDMPLLSCERHWEAGFNIFVSYDFNTHVVWKKPRWMPGDQFSSSNARVAECRRNLAAIASALQKYRDEKGALPRGLAELAPRWIEKVPHCPADFVKARPSYLYWPITDSSRDTPLVTCERHWPAGIDLYVTTALEVKSRPKNGLSVARALKRKDIGAVEAERDALMHGSLPYLLCALNEKRHPPSSADE
jgi:hypothetical protein